MATGDDVRPYPGFRSRRGWMLLIVSLLLMAAAILGIQTLSAEHRPTAWSAAYFPWALIGLFGFAVAYFLFMLRRMVALSRENFATIALLNAGQLDQAIAGFEELCRKARRMPRYWATFRTNLGTAWLRKGELAAARAHFETARDSGWLQRTPYPDSRVPIANYALCCALMGDLARAQELRREAGEGLSKPAVGHFTVLDVCLAAREGDFARAAQLAEAEWSMVEGLSSGFHMRGLRLLRAFSLSRVPSPNPQLLGMLIEGARPSRPGEFLYLAQGWPEFRAFLVEHGFEAKGP